MKRVLIDINLEEYPESFRCILDGAKVYDSSSSPVAKVIFIDKDEGYYLKCGEKNSLRQEAELTRYFHKKALAAEVLGYEVTDRDYFLTRRVTGEDCTYKKYLDEPNRLCDKLAEILRGLHDTDFSDCCVDRVKGYLETVEENYKKGMFDNTLTEETLRLKREEAYKIACENKKYLKSDVLIHGDYCLPNIVLKDWKLSAFIDVGNGGMGDRHIDLFWGAWSLCYNLKDKQYSKRFLEAYGKDKADFELLKVIAAMECFG